VSRSPTSSGRLGRCVLVALLAAASVGWIGQGDTSAAAPAELISVDPTLGGPLSSQDNLASVSGDGNVVAFTANAPVGSEFVSDWVYVRNRAAGVTTPVPAPFNVTAANGAVLSRDGCHVAFWGFYPQYIFNLPPFFFVIPAQWDIYSWNRCVADSAPTVISTGSTGDPFPALTAVGDSLGPLSISADGRYVAYIATTAAAGQRLARIDTSGTVTETKLLTNVFGSTSIDISDDGAVVGIGGQTTISDVTHNVVAAWTPPCVAGIAVLCNTQLVSVGNGGQVLSGTSSNPSLSADGRYVAFTSNTPDIVGSRATQNQVYVRDRVAGLTKLVSTSQTQLMSGTVDDPEISPDGTQIALVQAAAPPPGGKPVKEVFVARSTAGYFDTAAFDLVSYGVSGAPTSVDSFSPSMSSNGRYVAFSSSANNELSGVQTPTGLEVWMRQRPIALDVTPTLDFGTIDIGAQSAPQNAVVSNTSGVAINIATVTPPTAPFSMTANGCGGLLQPGATCAVTIVFSPTAPGGASSSVNVAGDGLSVSASLVGAGRSTIVPGSLTIKPGSANYGSAQIGTAVAAKKFVVSNPGQTPVPLAGVGLSGSGADQFAIISNDCTGSVAAGASCTIQVSATVTRQGAMTATLGVVGTGGQAAQATLRIKGTIQLFTPTLKMNPGVVSVGKITVAIGSGFPPDVDVDLAFDGEAPFGTVHTDAAGAFRFNFVLVTGVRIGGRQVIAIDQPQFTGVRAPLLIDLPKYRPSGFSSPQFTSGVRSLVNRGG
jgi:hypothetical protein